MFIIQNGQMIPVSPPQPRMVRAPAPQKFNFGSSDNTKVYWIVGSLAVFVLLIFFYYYFLRKRFFHDVPQLPSSRRKPKLPLYDPSIM